VSFLALSGEYPGSTAAGRYWAVREVVPLVLIAWLHLRVVEGTYRSHRANTFWIAAAALVDVTMLVTTAPAALHGAAPFTLALPMIAILLLVSVLATALRSRRSRSAVRT
jgi:hypothetical protein